MARISPALIFKSILLAISIGFGIGALEIGLRIFDRIKAANHAFENARDPVLGTRILPNSPGHDANGYRNESVPEKSEIVVLGDSQTWGVNVDARDAWPQGLEKISSRRVYNMGVGGYGPVQYATLTDKALEFSPRVVIVGLYFGNDFYDAYSVAYAKDVHKELRSVNVEGLLPDTIGPATDAIWNAEKDFEQSWRFSLPTFGDWLQGHTSTGRHLADLDLWPGESDFWHRAAVAWATEYPDDGAFVKTDPIQTVFTVSYRLEGLNLENPRIKEGLRITQLALKKIKKRADDAGTHVLVVLIPTKESVYSDVIPKENRSHNYLKLVEMETKLREHVKEFCVNEKISTADSLPTFSSMIAQGKPIYPTTTESHPNALGYGVLAEFVNDELTTLGWLK